MLTCDLFAVANLLVI